MNRNNKYIKTFLVFFGIFLITLFFVIQTYFSSSTLLHDKNLKSYFFAISFYLLAQVARYLRFQNLLLEKERNTKSLIGLFSFSTLASSFVPFKMGDFLKIYLIKNHLNSWSFGFITLLVERFFDIVVLLGIGFFIFMHRGLVPSILPLYTILFSVIFCMVLLYVGYPGTAYYFRKLIISTSKSKRGERLLSLLVDSDKIFSTLSSVLSGRWLVILFLTFFAWSLEVLAIYNLPEFKNSGFVESSLRALTGLNSFLGVPKLNNYFLLILMLAEGVPASLYVLIRMTEKVKQAHYEKNKIKSYELKDLYYVNN